MADAVPSPAKVTVAPVSQPPEITIVDPDEIKGELAGFVIVGAEGAAVSLIQENEVVDEVLPAWSTCERM